MGIGASAGGLEAFTQLLSALPPRTRMAFVLVQHLAPHHKSMLSQILSNETRIPVQEVKDGTRVEPNNVYVIPPNASLGIFHGVLHLMPRAEGARHLPIDRFFRSLAEDQKGRAIGVILAGTASDGALGLRAIKAEGGITLAQDPGTAKYDGMPRAAIAAGVVDFVLPPDKLALELAKIGEHPYVKAAPQSRQPDVMEPEDQLHKVFLILRTHSGVDFIHYKHATLRRRIKRRMVLRKMDRLADYVGYLEGHPEEIDELYQDILIHVTSFFRDSALFEHLKSTVYPALLRGRTADAPLRFWVPGCSTGEEAYSLAISLLEHIDAGKWRDVRIQIFASDISQQAIDKARVGFYPASIEVDVTTERLRNYFSKTDGGYRVSKAIRDLCVFARQDMTKDPPFSKIDLVTCRNVLIYLGAALQNHVISIFHYALRPSGFLVLGASETIGPHSDLFALADKTHKIYKKKSALMRLNMEFPLDYSERLDPQRRLPSAARSRGELSTDVDKIILDRFAPAGVVVNGDFQIVQFRGQTGSYLEPAPGAATLSVLKMAREGLAIELRSALHTSRRKNTTERRDRVRVKQARGMAEVNFEVIPLTSEETEKHYAILFWDAAPTPGEESKPKGKRKGSGDDKDMDRLGKLEQELMATREYLQSIIQDQEATNEELQSANEEILSSNEELQSTNEELETAKEELQSANEELNTVNDELQTRNQELGQTNSDLTNLLASVQIPIVIVGNDLRVRRLTPMAEKIFNLIPGDVGRPIGDIKHSHLQLDDLEALIRDAIDSISLREKEVRDGSGRWYSLRIRPYKNVDNRIDGAVLALVDIHRAKGTGADGGEAASSRS